ILASTGVVGLVVAALAVLSRVLGEADNLGEGSYGLATMLAYALLRLPSDLLLILPVIALLGTLLALGAMASARELVVLRSAGVSMARLAGSVSVAGLVLALLTVAITEYLGPAGMQTAEHLRRTALEGQQATQSIQAI